MPIYDFACKACGECGQSPLSAIPPTCPSCGESMKRDWGFNSPKQFNPHFNHTVGAYIDSPQEFRRALRGSAEKQAERLKMDVHYAEVGPSDGISVGVTGDLPAAVENKWHKQSKE